MEEKKEPNKNGEFLLDICPTTDEGVFTIYNITHFLPYWKGYERTNILTHHAYTIIGKKYSILILDWWDCLTYELAKKIASAWYDGNTAYYRLD